MNMDSTSKHYLDCTFLSNQDEIELTKREGHVECKFMFNMEVMENVGQGILNIGNT